jgi:hypothetical protein
MTWAGKAQGWWLSTHGLRCGGRKASRKYVRTRWGRAPWIRGLYSEVGPSLRKVTVVRKNGCLRLENREVG